MLTTKEKEIAKKKRDLLIEEITKNHLKEFYQNELVFVISSFYNGVWLEHAYDGVSLADYDKNFSRVSLNQMNLFFKNQREDGQLPFFVGLEEGKVVSGYNQIQECVSFGNVCRKVIEQNKDITDIKEIYNRLVNWHNWLLKYRGNQNGMIRTFCGYDTGHDNSARFENCGKYGHNFFKEAKTRPTDNEVLPMVSPDVNAIFYGNVVSLKNFALDLGLIDEASKWDKLSNDIKNKIINTCYDEKDDYFYDVDKNGEKIKIKSISILSMFIERVFSKEEGKRIFEKYFLSKEFFGTVYPYPSVAVSDNKFKKNVPYNTWNYYSQGLTMLRTLLWMDDYGLSDYLEMNMERWVKKLILNDGLQFSQELDPFTGEPSPISEYYSPTMLFFLHSLKRLGI